MASSRQDGAEDTDKAGPSDQSRRHKMSRSARAGLHFPVGRVDWFLRNRGYTERIGSGASVYTAAVLQYLISEIVDIAAAAATRDKKRRIAPKHLRLAINKNKELHCLLGHISVPQVKTSCKARKIQTAASSRKGKGKKSGKSLKAVSA